LIFHDISWYFMIFHDISTFFLMNIGMSFDHLIPSLPPPSSGAWGWTGRAFSGPHLVILHLFVAAPHLQPGAMDAGCRNRSKIGWCLDGVTIVIEMNMILSVGYQAFIASRFLVYLKFSTKHGFRKWVGPCFAKYPLVN
jgi:hypothetical protein